MIDYNAAGLLYPKGETRGDHKREKTATHRSAELRARNEAWSRSGHRCEAKNCGKRLERSGDLLTGAHFHHVEGRLRLIYQVLCYDHHIGQGHKRGRR